LDGASLGQDGSDGVGGWHGDGSVGVVFIYLIG
jgi:hypothetical protein